MAWRSGGNSNDEMCANLHKNSIVTKASVLSALQIVDRGFFVPEHAQASAYADAPLRVGTLHLSAPHIYGAVLNTLEMGPGNSFLNIGSGTGYLSMVCAVLGGTTSLQHGVECNGETFAFSQSRVAAFQTEATTKGIKLAEVVLAQANIFDVADLEGIAAPPAFVYYDRIYVGAGCPPQLKDVLLKRLALGGILVAPVGDDLIKVRQLFGPPL